MTKDKELVCLHDAYLSGTTNIASISKFNGRKQWRNYEGVRYNDWWVVDFTLAELNERVFSYFFKIRFQKDALISKSIVECFRLKPLEGNQIDSR